MQLKILRVVIEHPELTGPQIVEHLSKLERATISEDAPKKNLSELVRHGLLSNDSQNGYTSTPWGQFVFGQRGAE
ncbi:MarR family transcriptional regulator [Planctomyces sp. SH-PL14]|uniref:MarR family transcriptional regulator n=1 Tax=Planctomyces sp. SH-PL14 TaxID=1632864 RepID=UPI0012E92092|nr:MarR family transcriptional regulator [Planctomyces sp. SH-PL14]